MRTSIRTVLAMLLLLCCSASTFAADVWVSGYYPGWDQNKVPPNKIPFKAITHLFHFSCMINPDGSLRTEDFMLSDEHIRATVSAARAAKKKVLIVLGGADSAAGFRSATSPTNRAAFIQNIIAFVQKHHYDGVDLDWKPMSKEDNEPYRAFAIELHDALKQHDPSAMLTAATGPSRENPELGKLYASMQDRFDQINLMTYVLAGPWEGWVTWHGSPLFSGGAHFPNGGRELPSIEINMANFVEAGVDRKKLGIGLPFHGGVWTGGVTRPLQKWTTPPKLDSDVYYSDIMQKYYSPQRVHQDQPTRTPYLSIDKPGTENDLFISYCDPPAILARLNFMRDQGYGGCIIWHIAQDTLPTGAQPLSNTVAKFLIDQKKKP